MKLKVVGSGSTGNCYVLTDGTSHLVLDCGVPFQDIARAVNFTSSKIVGILLTHEHGDHSKSVKECVRRGLKVFTSNGTNEKIGGGANVIRCFEKRMIGDFEVMAFDVPHDAAEPFGFMIKHDSFGILVFITDAMFCKYKFPHVQHLLVEANHDADSITDEKFLRERIRLSHMSIDTCCDFVRINSEELKTVTLLHLSDRNSDEELFKKRIKEVSGCRVYVADKNVEIELNTF